MELVLDIVMRTSAVYLFLLLGIRLIGRGEAAQLRTVDLVLLLVLANSVQNAMVGSDVSLVGGFAAAATLLILARLLHLAEARFPWLRRSVEGEPLLLVRHGTVSRSAMARAGMSTDDLALAARRFGIASIQQIELAILEARSEEHTSELQSH